MIIALISIPIIGNVIEKAKISSLESSANGLIESGDNVIITIPEEGHVDGISKISVPIETIKNEVNRLNYQNVVFVGYVTSRTQIVHLFLIIKI